MTKQPCWIDSNGEPHLTREECQATELAILIGEGAPTLDSLPAYLVENAAKLVNILTMKDDSRPKARGVKKPRKKKEEQTLAFALGYTPATASSRAVDSVAEA